MTAPIIEDMSQCKSSKSYQYHSSSSLEELLAKVSQELDPSSDRDSSDHALPDKCINDGSNPTTYSGEISQNGDENLTNSVKNVDRVANEESSTEVDNLAMKQPAMGKSNSKMMPTDSVMSKSMFVNVGGVLDTESTNQTAQQKVVTPDDETEYDFAINQIASQSPQDPTPVPERRYPHQMKAEKDAKKIAHSTASESKLVRSATVRSSQRRSAPFKSIREYEQSNLLRNGSGDTPAIMTRSIQSELSPKPFPLTLIRRSSTGGNLIKMADTRRHLENAEHLNAAANNVMTRSAIPINGQQQGSLQKASLVSPQSSKRSLNRCPSSKNSSMRNYNSTFGLNGLHMVYDSNSSLNERNGTASLDRRIMRNLGNPTGLHKVQDRMSTNTDRSKGLHRCQTSPLILEPTIKKSQPKPSPRHSLRQPKPSTNVTNNENASPQNNPVKPSHRTQGHTLPSHPSVQRNHTGIQQHQPRLVYPMEFHNQIAFKRFFDSIKKYYPMPINREYHDETNVPDVVMDTIGQGKAAQNGNTSEEDDSKSDTGSSIRSTASAYWPPHLKYQDGNSNILSYRPYFSPHNRITSHKVLKPSVQPRAYKA